MKQYDPSEVTISLERNTSGYVEADAVEVVATIHGNSYCVGYLASSVAEWLLIENIRKSIEAMQIRHEASAFGVVTVSIGYVIHAADQIPPEKNRNPVASLESFILKADQALYRANENGRNQIKLYPE